MGKSFYAYMLLCSDGSYYTGHTDDLEKRVKEHQQGGKCTYTSIRRPIQLYWHQEFATREEAKEVETQIKKWSRKKKESLAKGNWDDLHEAAKKKNWQNHKERLAKFRVSESIEKA